MPHSNTLEVLPCASRQKAKLQFRSRSGGACGIRPGTEVEFVLRDGEAALRAVEADSSARDTGRRSNSWSTLEELSGSNGSRRFDAGRIHVDFCGTRSRGYGNDRRYERSRRLLSIGFALAIMVRPTDRRVAAARRHRRSTQIIFAELAAGFPTIELLDAALDPSKFQREELPWEAAFARWQGLSADTVGRGGDRRSPCPTS